MKRWFTALIALIIGVIVGYAYKQGEVNNLTRQVSALETRVTEATEEATAAAATRIEELKAELDAQIKLVEEQEEKISELEATLRMDEATSPAPAAQRPSLSAPTPSPPDPTTSDTPQ